MDDLVDLELEKIDRIINKIVSDPEQDDVKRVELELWQKIKEVAIAGRRTGLGITAEGDMLAAMGLRYGSQLATNLAREIHQMISTESYVSSIEMARERGCFAQWSYENEYGNPFINRILDLISVSRPEMLKVYEKYGRRNISNLTIAPTGSVSILAQTTSGVEPCFSVAYKRRRRTIDKTKATFTDDHGEMFEEYYVFHHKFTEWLKINKYIIDGIWTFDPQDTEMLNSIIAKSPYYGATSADVNWVDKVNMQGSIQKWVDHSISSTTNIPNNTPVSEVEKIYMAAYESGCKGMTIYREGSRSGILVNEKKEKFTYVDALKRPTDVACDIYHKTALKQNWMILVGVIEGKPYEIFAFPEPPNHSFPLKINKGTVTKVKRGVYKLSSVDETGKEYEIKNIIDLLENGDAISTRKFSMMLRHGIDPKWIIEDIEKYSLITSFDKVVQRVLRNYVEQEKIECPECGGTMTMADGCAKCMNCGYSKCG
jgi:ribonucleoside-diphosphate reductase alpha chain